MPIQVQPKVAGYVYNATYICHAITSAGFESISGFLGQIYYDYCSNAEREEGG